MPRADLLALTEDDLIALTNRGIVKRALRELEEGEPQGEIEESPAGELTCRWSDGVTCRVPAHAAIHDAVCSSGATGISRHLIRTVLAYQRAQRETQTEQAPPLPWDPGLITDETLEQAFGKPAVAKARRRFAQGVLVELVRSTKPLATFLDEPCVLRFMVPGDPRYVHADCAPAMQGVFVPLAVWAFRELAPERPAGLVSLRQTSPPVPVDLLAALELPLADLAANGLAGMASPWRDQLLRLETRCRSSGLIWPADIVAELADQYQRYQEHDARFSPLRLAHLAGELLIRVDAIRSDTGAVPQSLIRGTGAERFSEMAGGRFIGLGCDVQVEGRSVTATAFLQDSQTGVVVAVPREFTDAADEPPEDLRSFAMLAQMPALRGVTLAAMGAGQLLLKSVKRAPNHCLQLPRTPVTLHPQAFAWEQLRPPVLADSFQEMGARLATLPPSSLRSRRVTENVHVCAVASLIDARFDEQMQAVTALVEDAAGGRVRLVHPYTSRGRDGCEAMLADLTSLDARLRFVSGRVSLTPGGWQIRPFCLVFQVGENRRAIQPWVERWAGKPATELPAAVVPPGLTDPIQSVLAELEALLAELALTGLQSVDHQSARRWRALASTCAGVGLVRLASLIGALADTLEKRLNAASWNARESVPTVLGLLAMGRLAQDVLATPKEPAA